jgi:pyruvate ferredoxin oxidoreductase beta subunit
VARAAEVQGFRFLHILGPCPPGWRYLTAQSTEMARLAVESRYFPLLECDHGEWRVTFRPKLRVPVGEFLAAQGRFSHLSSEQIEAIQSHVDERWDLLSSACSPEPGVRSRPSLSGG